MGNCALANTFMQGRVLVVFSMTGQIASFVSRVAFDAAILALLIPFHGVFSDAGSLGEFLRGFLLIFLFALPWFGWIASAVAKLANPGRS